ncbi:MAG: polysaccharide biosynthesis/export family protein [Panacagrimonas sp.]
MVTAKKPVVQVPVHAHRVVCGFIAAAALWLAACASRPVPGDPVEPAAAAKAGNDVAVGLRSAVSPVGSTIAPQLKLDYQVRSTALPVEGASVRLDYEVRSTEFPIESALKPPLLKLDYQDSVRLTVLGYPELSGVSLVQKDGFISLPLAGEVVAVGRSIVEVRQEVEDRFSGKIEPREFRLRTGDTVKLFVWQHADLSGDSTVIADGSLSFPLAGQIPAEGRTLSELAQEITERLKVYLRDPLVSLIPQNFNRDLLLQTRVGLTVDQLRPRTVVVLGEVALPGLVTLRNGTIRVMEALAQSNYRNSTANLNGVVVIRNRAEGTPTYRQLHLGRFLAGDELDQNIYLQPDDIVIVPSTFIAKVGEFVDQFFSRTRPIFEWWISLQEARVAKDTAEFIERLNRNAANPSGSSP